AGMDQLCRHANVSANAAHTSFQDSRRPERFADLADVLVPAAKGEGRRARGDPEAWHVGERIEDLFGQAVAEVLVLLVRAQVEKGQDGDGIDSVVRAGR